MKKKILVLGTCCMITLGMLTGCGGSSSSKNPVEDGVFTTSVDDFSKKVEAVVNDNDELNGITLGSSNTAVGDGVSTICVSDEGEPIGFYVIKADEKGNIQSIITGFSWDDCAQIHYSKMLISSYMAIDSGLSYEEANEIQETVNSNIFCGGDDVEKNGIGYGYIGKKSGYAMLGQYPIKEEEQDEK